MFSGGVFHYSVDGHDDDNGDGGDDDNAGVLSLWGVMEAQVSVGNNDNEHFGATSPTHTSTPVLPDEYQQQAKGDFLFFLVQFWEVD